MNIIFVADIFGLTDEFKDLCQEITQGVKQDFNVECQIIGPYQNQPASFASEHDAYQYFMGNVTLDGYIELIANQLQEASGPKLLVGFSVGGSAIWSLLSSRTFNNILSCTCFYSSQIRHQTKLTPAIPTRLIFPSAEPHFSISDLKAALKERHEVTIEQSDYLHGFMNKHSINYDQVGYDQYVNRLINLLSQQLRTNNC